MRLSEKVAIVTGSASGIGRAIALGFAAEGAAVVVADINGAGAKETAAQITANGGAALAVKTDVSQKSETDELVRLTLARFGQVDILVTSAAVLEEADMVDMSFEQWDRTLDTNLCGVMYSVQSVVPEMKERGGGKIVILSSIAAYRGRARQTAYCAAEGTLVGFAANSSTRLGQFGINVNCIAPGIIDTDFPESLKDEPEYREFRRENLPLRRIGKPEDIVGPALFLASGDSDYVTGVTLIVDGGISIYLNGFGL